MQSDLLVINKLDLAPYVGVDLDTMVSEAGMVRRGAPVLLTDCRSEHGVEEVVSVLSAAVLFDK